ncbi:MAG: hypothetical protein ACTSSJ_02355 [Candidatus Odinarchaeia archaeon]
MEKRENTLIYLIRMIENLKEGTISIEEYNENSLVFSLSSCLNNAKISETLTSLIKIIQSVLNKEVAAFRMRDTNKIYIKV